MIHLLIADDHLLFRETLRRDLASEPDMLVVGVATNRDHVATLLSQALIDIVLLNLKLDTHPAEGLEIASWILEHSPATEVILLAGSVDADLESRAQKAGAATLISKATDQETLLRCIRRVYRGESGIPAPDVRPLDTERESIDCQRWRSLAQNGKSFGFFLKEIRSLKSPPNSNIGCIP